MDLAMEKKIVVKREEEQERIYSASSYYMEMSIARMLCDLNIRETVNEKAVLDKIGKIEEATGTVLMRCRGKPWWRRWDAAS